MLYSDVITAVRSSISVKRVVSYPSIHCFSVATPPHLRVVEHGVEPPDTLAEGYEQRFIGDFLVYFIRFHILAFYGRLMPPRNFLIRQVSTLTLLMFAQNTPLQLVGVAVMPVAPAAYHVLLGWSYLDTRGVDVVSHGNDEVTPSPYLGMGSEPFSPRRAQGRS